jgi:hypothetical protein
MNIVEQHADLITRASALEIQIHRIAVQQLDIMREAARRADFDGIDLGFDSDDEESYSYLNTRCDLKIRPGGGVDVYTTFRGETDYVGSFVISPLTLEGSTGDYLRSMVQKFKSIKLEVRKAEQAREQAEHIQRITHTRQQLLEQLAALDAEEQGEQT